MDMSDFTEQQLALIADHARVWEVRRFCQVMPSVVQYVRSGDAGLAIETPEPHRRYAGSAPDGALAALLRCLVHQLGADLAMVSLLDDHTQYFVSGASKANVHDVKVTIAESTRWYGCESVMHHGGLCERTITRQNHPNDLAIYEERDMLKNERTRDLPFVKGDVAKFRSYGGVPLNPYDGPNIGTVFFFSEKPSENGLSEANRSFLCETALHITKHLERAVEALEGKRVLRFNHGIASLLRVGSSEEIVSEIGDFSEIEHGQEPLKSNQYTTAALRLYRMAASILCDTFEFDAVRIQEVGSSRNYINHNPDWNGSKLLAQHLGPKARKFEEPSEALMRRLLDLFPRGGVFQIADQSGKVIAATNATNAAAVVDHIVSTELPKAFPDVKQITLMPLWDTYHERNIGVVLGFAYDQSRVYLGSTDLPSMSALCTTIMTQARRLETQAMDKIKSDFLGSVSHEMRTPLHGILSSLELLADTPYNTHQHDLLETARYSGVSLLNTIDRVLSFSKISSKAYFPEDTLSHTANGQLPPKPSPPNRQRATSSSEPAAPGVIDVCEGIIRREAQKLRLKETVRPELFGRRQRTNSWQLQPTLPTQSRDSAQHPMIIFDTNVAWSCRLAASAGFETVLTNLLDNALKFGELTGCVRVQLEMEETSVKLSVTDAGRGISPDFVRHSLFDTFTQEDPHVDGTGLGLSLVKRTVTTLGGDILVDSKKSFGSTFTATFPSHRIILGLSRQTPGFSSNNLDCVVAELPQLEMSLFTPRRWEAGDTIRGRRCTEMMSASFTRVLNRWFQTTVIPWDTPSTHSRLLFILHEDLEHVTQTYGDIFANTKCIVLCPDDETSFSSYITSSQDTTRIDGSVSVSKLQNALTRLFPTEVSSADLRASSEPTLTALGGQEISIEVGVEGIEQSADDTAQDPSPQSLPDLAVRSKHHEDGNEVSVRSETLPEATPEPSDKTIPTVPTETQDGDEEAPVQPKIAMEASSAVPSDKAILEPKLLLVDDNAVNLKVLSMYARKCSKLPSTSVGGGQEAIDAFNASLDDGENTSQPFDLIFLDLSMPEVSGFDVAKEIRETEARLQCKARTYICALTGLVSAKDRNAAYASGVDDYLVKPAKLRDLQLVVDKWRRSLRSE